MALTHLGRDRFAFGSGVTLELRGDRSTLRHFRREWGAARTTYAGDPDVVVTFASRSDEPPVLEGGHKTVGWRVWPCEPGARPLGATVSLRGRPLGFARSLVQGYFIEPFLALAAMRRGCVLLPAAAFEEDGRALLLVGSSGVGKTTLTARAAAAGWRMLGDDHVLVDREGGCWPFPRRLRFYTDLRGTAPTAYRRLGGTQRVGLAARTGLRTLTRGYVAPSLPVPPSQLGQAYDPSSLPLGRVAVIERGAGTEDIQQTTLEVAAALAACGDVLDDQREHLRRAGRRWSASLDEARTQELTILEGPFSAVPVERLAVPGRLGAVQAVEALWNGLGLAAREASLAPPPT
jgi:hypothetical protein